MERKPIRRALVSVYDKSGLADVGQALTEAGVELVSTGSTAKVLLQAGIPVTEVSEVTGFPEALAGRVKTLHPMIHLGLLADLREEAHRRELAQLEVTPFDLVVSNLYPFAETVASGADQDQCVEQIDIGGPTMVRAAAKNHASVAVITSPTQYPQLIEALAVGGFTLSERKQLAAAAFVHTANYDVAVARWMGSVLCDSSEGDGFAAWVGETWQKVDTLRYGENSHQQAALYRNSYHPSGLPEAIKLHGKQMSYNNYVDADTARRAAYDFVDPAVVIVKHANPCGVAIGADIAEAHRLAHASDPVSAFGGVIATNRPVSLEMAEQVSEVFTEVIVAPGYAEGAVEVLARKKGVRVLLCEPATNCGIQARQIDGGLLIQTIDALDAPGDHIANWDLVAGEAADETTLRDLLFAWKAARAVKSNAILLANGGASVGIGMGQVSRVDACRLAVERAGERAKGAVAASDAFFPFADGPELLIAAGIKAIVQPGGSIRDQETIQACQRAGVSMYFTGTRHFFH